ncbi:MAG: hypothetical protein JWO68_3897 [Actinomycetia bacterium]|nr:hypothetical protein [Actinomycetes bacterium]
MAERPDRRPLDLALEAFVYVPVGLAVSAKELLPKLAQRGRERITGQVTQARVVGQFAVHQGQVQAGKAFARAREEAPRPATSGPGGSDLAIPGYDSLSASQVLPRLEALSAEELGAVQAYEAAHRGRKTILGRIAQISQNQGT